VVKAALDRIAGELSLCSDEVKSHSRSDEREKGLSDPPAYITKLRK
jgi:hypothetical protein